MPIVNETKDTSLTLYNVTARRGNESVKIETGQATYTATWVGEPTSKPTEVRVKFDLAVPSPDGEAFAISLPIDRHWAVTWNAGRNGWAHRNGASYRAIEAEIISRGEAMVREYLEADPEVHTRAIVVDRKEDLARFDRNIAVIRTNLERSENRRAQIVAEIEALERGA